MNLRLASKGQWGRVQLHARLHGNFLRKLGPDCPNIDPQHRPNGS
jgi:hypothetical protein